MNAIAYPHSALSIEEFPVFTGSYAPSDYEQTLVAEAESWFVDEAGSDAQIEKYRRERIRHYKLVRDLLLDKLGTETMDILEVGGGPMPVSDLLRFHTRTVIDPLADEYRKVLPCPDHVASEIELYPVLTDHYDLVIATNSLDHVQDPRTAFEVMDSAVTRRGYIAIAGAENNAITHPHPAHVHNLTAETIHGWADADYETVWELTYARDGYRYGWREWDGKRGQPAFAILLRRCGS